jgi:hypothetical protein
LHEEDVVLPVFNDEYYVGFGHGASGFDVMLKVNREVRYGVDNLFAGREKGLKNGLILSG